jgi:hypothetical protein
MVGFPHSEIPGSKLIRSSPRLIAAYYVLHRLHTPRHPLDALKTLDRSHYQCPQYHQPVPALVFGERSPSSGRCHPTHHCIGFDRSDQKKPFFTHNHCSSPRVSGQTDSDVSLYDVQRSGHGRPKASTQPNLLSCLRRKGAEFARVRTVCACHSSIALMAFLPSISPLD